MRFHTNVKDSIDPELFKKRATRAAHAVAAAAAGDCNSFVPVNTGALRASMKIDGRKVRWEAPYAGPVYGGTVMVDPRYHKGGFPYPNYGPNVIRSRRGINKVPSARKMKHNVGEARWVNAAKGLYSGSWMQIARKELSHG